MNHDDFMAAAMAIFPGSREPLSEPPCMLDVHDGYEWQLGSGRWICGLCHPPSVENPRWRTPVPTMARVP